MEQTDSSLYYFQHTTINRVLAEGKRMLTWRTPEDAEKYLAETEMDATQWVLRRCPVHERDQ